MNLKNSKNTMNFMEKFNFLHDTIIGDIKIIDDIIEFNIFRDLLCIESSNTKIKANFGDKNIYLVDIYVYSIIEVKIQGELKYSSYLDINLKFQLIDICFSTSISKLIF